MLIIKKKFMKIINKFAVVIAIHLGVLTLPITVLAISFDTDFAGKFCNTSELGSLQLLGKTYIYMCFILAILAIIGLAVFLIFFKKARKTEKNPQLPNYSLELKKQKFWTKVFLSITIASIILSLISYLAFYNAREPYRAHIQELRVQGCSV